MKKKISKRRPNKTRAKLSVLGVVPSWKGTGMY